MGAEFVDGDKVRMVQRSCGARFVGETRQPVATVFGDRLVLSWADRVHSAAEYRMLTLGYTDRDRLIIVAHTEREQTIRIISARQATVAERRLYESA